MHQASLVLGADMSFGAKAVLVPFLVCSIRNNFLRVCLRLPAYSASAKVICFIIEKLGDGCPLILPN